MEETLIYGIQQMGVGVDDAEKGFQWYATRLGADACIFDDGNEATYMAKYMGGEPRQKRAILAMNLQGGSGYEIWQHTGRTPLKLEGGFDFGDLGINIAKIKSKDIQVSFDRLKGLGVEFVTDIVSTPDGQKSFYIMDPWDNILQIKETQDFYQDFGHDLGGVFGATLGVSDIDATRKLFDLIGYDQVVSDETGTFDDIASISKGDEKFRRVLLTHKKDRVGGFTALFGDSEIELVQRLDSEPKKLFEGRFWGDVGYIHLCFDIKNMKKLVEDCKEGGFPFQVLSNEDFDMGDANGHWGYIEDPDGTLIEFVETHKVPVVKAIGLNINLKNRDPKKPLPNWLIKAMKIKRKKF